MSESASVRVSSQRLLELAEQSQLVTAGDVRRVRASLQDALTGEICEDPKEVASAFVKEKLITRWQADMLLKGKHKGFRLGKYRLLGHLGTGGMSKVYLAEHLLMRRRVAIKVLPPQRLSDSSYLARFRREAEAVAQLDHPNIVRAFDIDQEGSTHYFVMELVDGRDLLQIVNEDGPLSYEKAADYIAQVATALDHAHQAGLVHRDVKPGNCLVDRKGTVKLLDLGLAKFAQDSGPSLTLMHDENVLGTADYLAPEQARNSHTVDHRADFYGLGCTLYFVLSGKPPFSKGTLSERLIKHQTETPPELRKYRRDVPRGLVAICDKLMQKEPSDRFQSGKEVADAINKWLRIQQEDTPLDSNLHRTRSAGDSSRESPNRPASSHHGNGVKSKESAGSRPVVDSATATIDDDEQELALMEESVILKQATPVPVTTNWMGNEKSSITSAPTLEVELPVLPNLSDVNEPEVLSQSASGEQHSAYLMRTRSKSTVPTKWWLATAIFAALIAIVIVVVVAIA